jgi:hypothetical protein
VSIVRSQHSSLSEDVVSICKSAAEHRIHCALEQRIEGWVDNRSALARRVGRTGPNTNTPRGARDRPRRCAHSSGASTWQ